MPHAEHASRWAAKSSAPRSWLLPIRCMLLHAGNYVEDSGGTQIAEAMKVNQTITHLDLSGKRLGRGHMWVWWGCALLIRCMRCS